MRWLMLLIIIIFNSLHSETDLEEFNTLKFYIQQNQFDLAKDLLESTEFDSTLQDSLALQKILLYKQTKEWENAIDSAIDILVHSKDNSLQSEMISVFNENLVHLSPVTAIEKITTVINQTKNPEIRRESLFLLASVYERNHLFGEAKDVYFVILNDSTQVDTMQIYFNILQADISLQNFEQAIETIDSLLITADSLDIADLYFYQFITFYSSSQKEKAKTILMKFYLHYPEYKNRKEILEALAELYYDNKQYLLSLYFWNELYQFSSAYKKITILNTLQEVKESFVKDSLAIEQFKNFKPIFEDIDEEK